MANGKKWLIGGVAAAGALAAGMVGAELVLPVPDVWPKPLASESEPGAVSTLSHDALLTTLGTEAALELSAPNPDGFRRFSWHGHVSFLRLTSVIRAVKNQTRGADTLYTAATTLEVHAGPEMRVVRQTADVYAPNTGAAEGAVRVAVRRTKESLLAGLQHALRETP